MFILFFTNYKSYFMSTKRIIGIYLMLCLFFFVSIPISLYLFRYLPRPLINLSYIACAGGLGGSIYCIRGMYKAIAEDTFDTKWVWWYLYRPFISAIMGVITYFLIVGGLLSLSANGKTDLNKGIMLYSGLGFLAGFYFSKIMEKLDGVSDKMFK